MPRLAPGTLLLAGVIALTACGNGKDGMTQEEQFAQLMRRPDLEQVTEQYQQMQLDIAEELTTAIGLPEWTPDDKTAGGSLCGHEFGDLGVDARTKTPPILGTAASIPDTQWDQAVRIAEKIVRQNGFGGPERILDRAGHHVVEFKDKYGGDLTMGTQVHSSLSVRTGCHLTAEAQQRGTPTPLPEHNR